MPATAMTSIVGSAGDDVIIWAATGNDVLSSVAAGNDVASSAAPATTRITWDPGDGSDVVDGGTGHEKRRWRSTDPPPQSSSACRHNDLMRPVHA